MVKVPDLTITSFETITMFGYPSGGLCYALDELQSVTIDNNQEVTEITGKMGRKLANLKKNKSVKISGTSAFLSGGLLESQTGGEFTSGTNGAVTVRFPDYITVNKTSSSSAATATTTYTPTGTAGAEILDLYVRNADGTLGQKYTQTSDTASTGKFTYSNKTITFAASDTTIADGTEILVYYDANVTGNTLENSGAKYSDIHRVYLDALAEDKCNNVYRVQFYIPKGDVSGDFSLDFGDNATTHPFEIEALAGGCGAYGDSDTLWTYTVFGLGTDGKATQPAA